MLGMTLLTLIIFIAVGTVLGTWLKVRQPVVALSIGVALPLFFLSGAFGPISFRRRSTRCWPGCSPSTTRSSRSSMRSTALT